MDASKKKTNPHPLETANCLSEVTFWWTIREFIKGYSRDLEADDLYEPLKDHKSDRLGNVLEKNWNKELKSPNGGKKPHPSFLKAMVKSFGPRFMCFGFVLLFVELVVKVAQPIFLGRLIRYFTPSSGISKQEAYLYALGVIASSGISTIILHPYMMGIMHMGMQMRVAACSLIYRKALRLSHSAMGLTTAGQVVNLLSNDVNRFDVVPIFMHFLWVGPIETVICSYLMWAEMGMSALIGIATLLLTIPLQGYLGKKTSSIRMKTAVRTDERVRLMNEIISGIQVIKMYTWEKPFAKLVSLARRYEIKQIKLSSYIRGVYLSFIMFTTRVTLFVSVISYVLFGNQITAEKVFVMTSFYNIVRQTMTIFFPQAISQLAEGSVSIKRLQSFLLLDEVSGSSHSSAYSNGGKPKEVEVCLQGAKAQWNFEMADATLIDINLKVASGQLVAVIGPVGAGKTSLIHAILGELPLSSGTIQVSGSLSYAAQEPWLFAGSLRQNITFGQTWNAARYREVIRVCALETDLAQLPYGDRTIVGERGVSLSGGQRARVSLARAVYKEADIYLLDDPLSAVDAHVGRHLFDDCIRGFLKHKAVVLVTHQLQFLNQATHIVILNNGRIEAEGTYSELQDSGLDFGQLLEELKEETDVDTDLTDKEEERKGREGSSRRSSEGSNASHLEGLLRQISIKSMRSSQELEVSKSLHVPQEVAEIRTTGTVSGEVYSKYFSAGGNCCVIFTMFALFFLAQLAGSGADYWVTYWTNWEESRNKSEVVLASFNESVFNNTETEDYESDSWLTTELCIYIYSGIIGSVLLISIIRSFVFFNTCMRASVRLHDSMFSAITRATMAFFNNNPSGRILNRFSKDMGAIDEMLPAAMIDALQIGLTLTGIIIVVAIVNYWLLVPTGVIALIFYFMRVVYITTSRSVKRLEGITRSPVFTHLNASIQGLSTIRAFRAQKLLETQFDGHQDLHSSAWYLFISTSRAFGYWLDVICFFYIALVTLSFLVIGNEFGGNVGLAITQAIGLTGMFQWGMRQSAELENQMTSVERVLEFSKLDSEPPLQTERKNAPPKDWPMKGEVTFEKLSLRYSPSEPSVLKQISFTVNAGEKVGIVGRTGAGKSSLISALFRLAECHEGRILIDGVDTSSLGLHQLRASISIIPQEPVLFSGTMRKNLDPFDDYPDAVLWKALEEVELRDAVTDLPGGLSAHMSEGGSNFSVGQRQLVCLARAIVRKNKILVLDEATANVDPKTDALIQNTIRRKFASCTVLTIAHRLHTIMDADRVLVMEAGRVAEFAAPSHLLEDPDSMLSRLAEQTGHANAKNLRHRASIAKPEQL